MANNSVKQVGLGGGGGSVNPEFQLFTLTAPQIAAKQVILSSDAQAESVFLQVSGGGDQIRTIDWNFSAPNIITWSGLGLDGILAVGNVIAINYLEA